MPADLGHAFCKFWKLIKRAGPEPCTVLNAGRADACSVQCLQVGIGVDHCNAAQGDGAGVAQNFHQPAVVRPIDRGLHHNRTAHAQRRGLVHIVVDVACGRHIGAGLRGLGLGKGVDVAIGDHMRGFRRLKNRLIASDSTVNATSPIVMGEPTKMP